MSRAPLLQPVRVALVVLGLCGAGLFPGTVDRAQAHTRSVSYSTWEIGPGGARVALRIKLLELSRLGPAALASSESAARDDAALPSDPLSELIPRRVVLIADERPCAVPAPARRHADAPGWVRYEWRVDCPTDASRLAVRSSLLLDVAPSHMHFARVRFEATSNVLRERVLTEDAPQFVLRDAAEGATTAPQGSGLLDYVALGVEHILTGWDHLAFVLGLLLLARRLGEVARLVTGFTLAHSLTLALTVLDWVDPRSAAVEAVIAYSVALVATERAWLAAGMARTVPMGVLVSLGLLAVASAAGAASLPLRSVLGLLLFTACYFALSARQGSAWLRVCLTFAFGLVHGFGFAGVLREMTLPTDRLVPALLGFNLGVEVGQIGVVLLVWPVLRLASRRVGHGPRTLASECATAGLCGLGVYWLCERAF